jgi:DNA-binding protein HU-beta
MTGPRASRENCVTRARARTGRETLRRLDAAAQIIIEAARAGEEVRVNGLGFFDGLKREARTGRNPSTGEPIKIAASTTLRFRVGKAAKEQLNLPTAKTKTAAKSKSKSADSAAA